MAAAAALPARDQLQERVLLYQYGELLQVCAVAVTAYIVHAHQKALNYLFVA